MVNRKRNYRTGIKDNMLKSLEKQGVDVEEYLNGSIFDIQLNKKKYKVFQLEKIEDLKGRIDDLERKIIYNEIVKTYHDKGQLEYEKSIDGKRKIKEEIKAKLDVKNNYVLQKLNIEKTILKKGFVDIVFDGKKYRFAPDKVGRPTDEKKDIKINVRLSQEQYDKLEKYAEKFGQDKNKVSFAIRSLIDRL